MVRHPGFEPLFWKLGTPPDYPLMIHGQGKKQKVNPDPLEITKTSGQPVIS